MLFQRIFIHHIHMKRYWSEIRIFIINYLLLFKLLAERKFRKINFLIVTLKLLNVVKINGIVCKLFVSLLNFYDNWWVIFKNYSYEFNEILIFIILFKLGILLLQGIFLFQAIDKLYHLLWTFIYWRGIYKKILYYINLLLDWLPTISIKNRLSLNF